MKIALRGPAGLDADPAAERHDPDVPEADRVSVVLQADMPLVLMWTLVGKDELHKARQGPRGVRKKGIDLAADDAGPGWGGTYDKEPDRLDNNFQLMEAGGRKFLALGLEFGPRADVVRWANEVMGDHPGHEVVLRTHAFVYNDDTRYDWATHGTRQAWNPHTYGMAKASNGDVHEGEQLWQELIAKHRNVIMTFNGHVLGDGLGRLTTAAGGRDISQQLVNFQMRPNGGDGWLRLIEMRPDGTAHAWDYSPLLKSRNESPQNQFAFPVATIG